MKHSQELRHYIQQDLLKHLPGEEAQHKLAPLKRKEEQQLALLQKSDPRRSAVMLILYPDSQGQTTVPFILRNKGGGVHGGQVAFPGGRVEKEDQNERFTAIRETHEEIAVEISDSQIIGALSSLYVPVSNFIIQPYVAWLDKEPAFIPEVAEVQKVLPTSLSHLLDPANQTEKFIETNSGYILKAPGIDLSQHFLWGATAMMLSEFLSLPTWRNEKV